MDTKHTHSNDQFPQALLERIREGDAPAWEALIEHFSAGIYTFVRCQLKDESQVDDIVSETFLGVYRNISNFRKDSSLKTWIYSICIHKIKDARRRNAREQNKLVSFFSSWDLFSPPPSHPEEDCSLRADLDLLLHELKKLPEKYRMVLICRFFNELSLKETCALLEITENQLHQRIRVGRKRLLEQMNNARKIPADGPSWLVDSSISKV